MRVWGLPSDSVSRSGSAGGGSSSIRVDAVTWLSGSGFLSLTHTQTHKHTRTPARSPSLCFSPPPPVGSGVSSFRVDDVTWVSDFGFDGQGFGFGV